MARARCRSRPRARRTEAGSAPGRSAWTATRRRGVRPFRWGRRSVPPSGAAVPTPVVPRRVPLRLHARGCDRNRSGSRVSHNLNVSQHAPTAVGGMGPTRTVATSPPMHPRRPAGSRHPEPAPASATLAGAGPTPRPIERRRARACDDSPRCVGSGAPGHRQAECSRAGVGQTAREETAKYSVAVRDREVLWGFAGGPILLPRPKWSACDRSDVS